MKYLRQFSLIILSFMALFMFAGAPQVMAADITSGVCNATRNQPAICNDTRDAQGANPFFGKDGLVTKGIQIFLIAVGIISVFIMLIMAAKMITSNGDPASITKARNGIIYAVVGLVVAMSAQMIIITVINKLG